MDNINKLASFTRFMNDEVAEDTVIPLSDAHLSDLPLSLNVPPDESTSQSLLKCKNTADLPIHMAALPNGQRIPLLKTMLTSICERNCNYCCFRTGRDFQRETFRPDELARSFMDIHQKGLVQGLFLSSGVAGGGLRTQDRIIATAEILRMRFNFKGYIHLKIMPGAEYSQVLRAMELADRVSINLEGPSTKHLQILAPQKQFLDELIKPLQWVDEIRKNQPGYKGWNARWPSSTTQFVAGGAGESDLDLLRITDYLHLKLHLGRVYYSGFKPVEQTPLEDQPAINPWRTHRLYQASFLLRDYGFDYEEMPFIENGFLPLDIDPKEAWARTHLSQHPVEINQAGYADLLRIPGIGKKGARSILAGRKLHKLKSIEDLIALGIQTGRVSPYILLDGRMPARQLSLW